MGKLQYRESLGGTYDLRLEGGHCVANAGIGDDWLTIYIIETEQKYRRQGEATRLIKEIKKRCANTGRTLRVWHPMDFKMENLCKKLKIETI